jgi:ferric-dicitrate binding protein FerR (iron transport regulator)
VDFYTELNAMNREILYRLFEGKTSIDEEKRIRQWLDQSKENEKIFLEERVAYDALLLNSDGAITKRKSFKASIPWVISIAATVALLFIVANLYLSDQGKSQKQYNTVIVPPGQSINLILADNSNVWLNANTTLRYPSQFSGKNRTVYLDGEAYFEVSTNKKKPFIVKTGQGDVRVTGTSFNVEAYSKYNSFETSLFTGSVDIYKNEIKLVTLNPNEKSTLENEQLLVSTITDTDKYLWRKGLIAFNNKKLEEILLSLEKYFDVDIQIDTGNLPQKTYTGKFRQSDGVDYALRVLQKSIHFTYERDEDSSRIYIH